ncbi:Uncharacterised protein [Mycobacteroides abscessus]|nr:Uncharacterised protein [Mycobacteroides abscessus]
MYQSTACHRSGRRRNARTVTERSRTSVDRSRGSTTSGTSSTGVGSGVRAQLAATLRSVV